MKKKLSAYWLCQIGGWTAYFIVYVVIYLTLRLNPQPHFYQVVFLDLLFGLCITHVMRMVIKNRGILKLSLPAQIQYFFILTVVASLLWAIISIEAEHLLRLESETASSFTLFEKTVYAMPGSFFFILIWNIFYFTYHDILKSQKDRLDKVRLESLVKELELKTIKAHINPHFIFNALNSIRALVDEDPARARTAVTELSNILRSSMQAEKLETTPLEKELNIVKDYLALEHIRFEDRLKVEYDIDEDTLDQPIPPMMLQTLVENAIKHGISKQVDGGMIKIISDFRGDQHELIVQNTGHLNGSLRNADGFGIASTQNRLQLLFGQKAHFQIKDTDGNIVEAKVTMPVHTL
jgi:sensor histidine kinase YesM